MTGASDADLLAEVMALTAEMADETVTLVVPDFSVDPIPTYREMVDAGFHSGGSRRLGDSMLRDATVHRIGYALPCREAIEECLRHGPLVEVGAGAGLWASIIARHGGDVVATDRQPDGWKSGHGFVVGCVHPVETMDAVEAVRRHPDRNVLVIWPTLGKSWAADVLEAMEPGRVLIHVGEIGGCTSDGRFARRIRGKDFETIGGAPLPTWPTMHDALDVFRKVREADVPSVPRGR